MKGEVLNEIFLDIKKVYDTLDQYICQDILTEYGVRTWALRLLHWQYNQLVMVERTRGYHR